MASLSLLAPLQEADFAVLVAAWLAGKATGAPRRACRLLAARSPAAAEFSEAVLENVYAKLTAADLLRGLAATPSTATIACCSATCTLCGLDLEIGATCSTYALTWARGLQRVDYERRQCRGCLSQYSSCWRTDRTATMFLCSTPVHLGFLQFLAHPQQDACAFIDCVFHRHCPGLAGHSRLWTVASSAQGALSGLDVLAQSGNHSCCGVDRRAFRLLAPLPGRAACLVAARTCLAARAPLAHCLCSLPFRRHRWQDVRQCCCLRLSRWPCLDLPPQRLAATSWLLAATSTAQPLLLGACRQRARSGRPPVPCRACPAPAARLGTASPLL